MSQERNSDERYESTAYQFRVRGHLHPRWAEWFGGMTIDLLDDGDTLLSGPVVDQAALHGLIKKVRDVGLPIVSVVQIAPDASPGRGGPRGFMIV